jgi:hypothetical protein
MCPRHWGWLKTVETTQKMERKLLPTVMKSESTTETGSV